MKETVDLWSDSSGATALIDKSGHGVRRSEYVDQDEP